MCEKEFLDFAGEYFLAAATNHIFESAGDLDVAVFIHYGHIASMKPTSGVDGIACGTRIIIVTAHYIIASIAKFTWPTARNGTASGWINDFLFLVRHHFANGTATQFNGIINLGHVTNRRRLSHTAGDCNLATMHFRNHAFHHLDRAWRACHNAGPESR